jgi:hypothetical protein
MKSRYIFTCFLLMLPILVWNILLTNHLPEPFQAQVFQKDIPLVISYGETIARIGIFVLAFLMPLKIVRPVQKAGLAVYLVGLVLYFSSWLLLIFLPDNVWSESWVGFMAPAYTPLVWLGGIGLMGDSFSFNLPYRRWLFWVVAVVFLVFHNLHTYMIYCRVHY